MHVASALDTLLTTGGSLRATLAKRYAFNRLSEVDVRKSHATTARAHKWFGAVLRKRFLVKNMGLPALVGTRGRSLSSARTRELRRIEGLLTGRGNARERLLKSSMHNKLSRTNRHCLSAMRANDCLQLKRGGDIRSLRNGGRHLRHVRPFDKTTRT